GVEAVLVHAARPAFADHAVRRWPIRQRQAFARQSHDGVDVRALHQFHRGLLRPGDEDCTPRRRASRPYATRGGTTCANCEAIAMRARCSTSGSVSMAMLVSACAL